MINVLHITAHLGGGVGKVLSRLVEHSARQGGMLRHTIACLESPEKTQFADTVAANDGQLLITPSRASLDMHIRQADIVQLEWWHHPEVAALLASGMNTPMRLLVWSHVSGLHTPALTPEFVSLPARFLFTSPCSASAPRLAKLGDTARRRTATVFSSGGFGDLPSVPERSANEPPRVGYLGSLTPAKMHPRFLDFVAAVDDRQICIDLVGDSAPGMKLMEEARQRGLANRLRLRGYQTDVADVLAHLDILAYPLNPQHYGTTENALLEAMAMGVVPIVLDNPAERCLVEHGRTGLVVTNPTSFAEALRFLMTHPKERASLSAEAARSVRERFAIDVTYRSLLGHYMTLMTEDKCRYDFAPVLGAQAADWFLSAQGDEAWRFKDDGSVDLSGDLPYALRENSKGSVFHYARSFPEDRRLAGWAASMTPLT